MVVSRGTLVADADALLGEVGAPRLRQDRLAELRVCYKGTVSCVRPIHVWVHGPPGTGKTASLRYLLDEEVPKASVLPICIDCRARFTLLDLLEQVTDFGDIIRGPVRTRERQVTLLLKALGQRRCVIVLDHVDYLRREHLSELLILLCSLSRASVVCVSNRSVAAAALPDPVLSRLAPRQVFFPSYTQPEVEQILRRCAESALAEGAWTDATITRVAEQARGDARRALALLRHAVQRAEDAGTDVVLPRHVVTENFEHFNIRVEEELRDLSVYHRLLYDLVAEHGPVQSGDLVHGFTLCCRRERVSPIAGRTINKYLNTLVLKRILFRDRGAGTTGWIYRVASQRHNQDRSGSPDRQVYKAGHPSSTAWKGANESD